MLKRFVSLRIATLLGGLLLASACTAQPAAPEPYTEGNQYITLSAPYQRYSDEGKVEVVEVFSYGCIHCAHFAPIAAELAKNLPAGAELKLVPAPFSADWVPFARAYYAAKELGALDGTHMALFNAKWVQHYPINSMDELADFYARNGVDRAQFLRVAMAEKTTEQMKSDLKLLQKWQVDGTPAIIVNGKYRVGAVSSFEEMVAVAQWLVKRELAQK